MTIKTLFFASYRDLVGAATLEVELAAGASVSDLVRVLRAKGDPWAQLPATPTVAVNHRYVRGDQVLAPDDEVALIPPVAGG